MPPIGLLFIPVFQEAHMQADVPCKIEWILIPARELALAKRFYSEIFGFKLTPFHDRFVVFEAGNLKGGLDQDLDSCIHGISFSITVSSINDCLKKVAEFNCEIVRKPCQLSPNGGFSARFRDPNGNMVELYSDVL